MPSRDSAAVDAALAALIPSGARLCVAFSGGLDSTVLLHAVASRRAAPHAGQGTAQGWQVRAIHVNHGLQPAADGWERHCAVVARRLGVPFTAFRVTVVPAGHGLEAAARAARYQALARVLQPGEYLLTAHHADDQLETHLLHLMRGSGPRGLAGIPLQAPLGAGWILRPLLMLPREVLRACARERSLDWVEDPTNADAAPDRNFLRHRVIGPLWSRWPAAAGAAARSAALLAESCALLDELAAEDGARLARGAALDLPGFLTLSEARQRNLLRYRVRLAGWPAPPERRLRAGLDQMRTARADRQPRIAWAGREIRRYRQRLYLVNAAALKEVGAGVPVPWNGEGTLELGPVRGRLTLEPVHGTGLRAAVVHTGLTVAFRDRAHPADGTLKHVFQQHGVVPWMRAHVPLLYAGDQLAAVGDLHVRAWCSVGPGEPGLRVHWTAHGDVH